MVDLTIVGLAVILLGFVLLVLASISSSRSEEGEKGGRVRGGGVVMIGPIPIIFGSDARWASVAIVLAIVLLALGLVFGGLVRLQ